MRLNPEQILLNLEQMEFARKPLTAKDQLRIRLAELADGRNVPVVVFNCLEFSWSQEKRNQYPVASVFCTPQLSICRFYSDEIGILALELELPNLEIIVPDSELLDERVFSFAESREQRLLEAQKAKTDLTRELTAALSVDNSVFLWSEYCNREGLKNPSDYTKENRRRIEKESELQAKVRKQIRDSEKLFGKEGIDLTGVNKGEIFNRIAWYLAMYMGEGQALAESRAICLNLEDSRVPYWFIEGAQGKLPILNPVDSKKFYDWRKQLKSKE